MWEISNSFQIVSVFRSALLGGGLCLFYDVLRSIRKQGVNSFLAVFFQDLFFFFVLAPVTFFFLLALTNGELRAYFFVFVILGFTITRFTVSYVFSAVLNYILSLILKLLSGIKFVFYPLFKKINLILNKIFVFLSEKVKNMRKYIKKLLKKQSPM